MGVRGRYLSLLQSYLTDRTQHVSYNGNIGSPAPVTHGVPQGNILRPLLFLAYINDIVNVSDVLHFSLFADDVYTLTDDVSKKSLIQKLNIELAKIKSWVNANNLSINLTKICCMFFSSHIDENLYYPPMIGEIVIPEVYSTKFLGLYIDHRLHWHIHTKNIEAKLSKICGLIYHVRENLNIESLVTLYYSLVYSTLIYCIPIWGGTWAK